MEAVFQSTSAPFIDGLLAEKHANGYTYKSEELVLNRFDSYCADNGLDTLEISQNFQPVLVSFGIKDCQYSFTKVNVFGSNPCGLRIA